LHNKNKGMDNIKVYGVDEDVFNEFNEEDLLSELDNEQFANEAERQGLVWSLKGFQEAFNIGEVDSNNCLYIRFIEN